MAQAAAAAARSRGRAPSRFGGGRAGAISVEQRFGARRQVVEWLGDRRVAGDLALEEAHGAAIVAGLSPAWRRARRCGRRAGGSAASARRARSTAAAAPSARGGTKSGTSPSWRELHHLRRRRRAGPSSTSASAISRSSPVSCGTRAIRRPPVGVARVVVPDEHPAARAARPGPSRRACGARARVGDVVHGGDAQDEVEARRPANGSAVPERLHRRDLRRRARAARRASPPDGSTPVIVVAGPGQPRREHAGAAADVEPAPRRAVLDHERGRACAGSARRRGPAATRRSRAAIVSKWELVMRSSDVAPPARAGAARRRGCGAGSAGSARSSAGRRRSPRAACR